MNNITILYLLALEASGRKVIVKVNLKDWEHVLNERGVRVNNPTLRMWGKQKVGLPHIYGGLVNNHQPACASFQDSTRRVLIVQNACSRLCQACLMASWDICS